MKDTRAAQVLSNLNENFFDFFDFVVKKFRGSSLVWGGNYFQPHRKGRPFPCLACNDYFRA
jgi:hypothetical protein